MKASNTYTSYLNSMKNYKLTQGRKDYQAPFAEGFEAIYDKAKKEEITLSNAKDFLKNLSSSELGTLQKYSGLADNINIDMLSDEGSYNLLMHDKEQYDFNSDGVAEVGIGKSILPIPINMPTDIRDTYISVMNSLSDKDRMRSSFLTLDPARLISTFNNEPYTPTKMDYNYLKMAVQSSLNPTGRAYTSEDTKVSIRAFWDAFNASYKGDKTQQKSEKRSGTVTQFLKDLHTKGAVKFLADFNQKKIDELVKEFEDKLIKKMGDSPKALQEIAKLVEDYKTKLIKEMQEKMENEKNQKGELTSHFSGDSVVQMLIAMQKEKSTEPLKELLA